MRRTVRGCRSSRRASSSRSTTSLSGEWGVSILTAGRCDNGASSRTRYTATASAAGTWNDITFDNPYDWHKDSNLLVEICWSGIVGGTTTNPYYQASFGGGSQATGVYDNSGNGCAIATAPTNSFFQPYTRITYGSPSGGTWVYSWSPGATLADSTVQSPMAKIDSASPITYTVTVTNSACNVTANITPVCDCENQTPYIWGGEWQAVLTEDTAKYIYDDQWDVYISEVINCDSVQVDGTDFLLDCSFSAYP